MRVRLLGTGSADGWPNPFCSCGSCESQRQAGILRGQTSALVDDVLLLDAGPEAASAAARHGVSLSTVRHLLITHAHPDHFGPQLLLFRSWVRDEPLDVVGPAAVVAEAQRWVAPDAPVTFTGVAPGDALSLGEYQVRVLPAAHQVMDPGDAVLYGIETPSGERLLWACDTGPWPADWFDAVRGARYDVVLLEETFGTRADLGAGHLHLESFADTVAAFRGCEAVVADTEVVAVHLSHHNPPEAELVDRLGRCGARPGRDGEVLGLPDGSAADEGGP